MRSAADAIVVGLVGERGRLREHRQERRLSRAGRSKDPNAATARNRYQRIDGFDARPQGRRRRQSFFWLRRAVAAFTESALQADDVTLLVLEYAAE